MTETTERLQANSGELSRRRPSSFGWEVQRRVEALQNDLKGSRPSAQSRATATMAQLRRGVGRQPGTVPAIWEQTIGWLWEPGDDGTEKPEFSTEPTYKERAAHAAMTLYAVHQQSRAGAMHAPGHGFGRSVRQLAARDGSGAENEKPARRRFNAVVTATSFDEAVYHLRGLVMQLRSADIPVDYGMLADDLHCIQYPERADDVRRRWGRQYHQFRPKAPADSDAATKTNEEDAA